MESSSNITEVSLDEAKSIVDGTDKKFIWVGRPTNISIPEILDVSDTKVLAIEPDEIPEFEPEKLNILRGCVFVCPHGRTAGAVVRWLQSKGVEAYNLKGGATAIVGEIF